uniref:Schlafen AlbA-2 domain-containing protein n=1 Tax=Arthrobacter sp. J3.40 TaxID=347209 RepID=I3W104_9MICC|nr:hypothetical protein [Arthrobacter sp. J3.40]AFK89281.1 hypothetical protein [Arthrobacter sp. J3.40]
MIANRWTPTTEEDIISSISGGTLRESHYLEVKQSANNSSIAATLASLAIDGGTFILGIEEVTDDKKNKSLNPKPLLTEGLPERIDQIARNSVEPSLIVRTRIIPSAQDSNHGYAVVVVPPSPVAPHMAGGKYYARGEASKHSLGDAEVLRYHQHRQQQLELGARLLQDEQERDYLPADKRSAGHIYIVAEPLMPVSQSMLEALVYNSTLFEIVVEGCVTAAETHPDPRRASNKVIRSNGTAFVSYAALGEGRTPNAEAHEDSVEGGLLDIEVTHTGGFRVYLGRGTDHYNGLDDKVIMDSNAVGYLQHLMSWIARLSEAINYGGAWTIGIRATGLRGLRSSRSIQRRFDNNYGAMDAETYQKVIMASLAEIQDTPNRVVKSLIGHYLRALGTEWHYSLERETAKN